MYLRSDDRGPQMSNGMALRIAIFGGVALVLFGILFFRLWFLQVLNGDQYLAEANNNRTREFRVSAPRGNILDRNGEILVANRVSLALQVNPQKLPEDVARKRAELKQLAELTHTTLPRLRRTMREELKLAPGAAGDAAPRRRQLPRLLPGREQSPLPRGRRRARLRAPLPDGTPSPRTSSAASARSPKKTSKSRATRGWRPATRSARKGSRTPTTSTCAASRG